MAARCQEATFSEESRPLHWEFEPHATAATLKTFVERRAKDLHISTPEVYDAKVFVPENTSDLESIGARLVIAESQLQILHNRSFWLRPTYRRPWNFQKSAEGAVLEVDRSAESAGTPGMTTNLQVLSYPI